jgi:predicted phosphoribosyltransferase
MRFRDRRHAGEVLAARLARYADRDDVIVLALPRSGVPVGFEVAERLRAPLDVFLVRKLGLPGQEELAMGAIASGDVRVLNEGILRAAGVTPETLEAVTAREREELVRRERAYRGDRAPLDVRGRTVLLIDDGLATGATMRAAALALRRRGPGQLVLAVPTASADTCETLEAAADVVVCISTPEPFVAVGYYYDDFAEISDEEVRELLRRAGARASRTA